MWKLVALTGCFLAVSGSYATVFHMGGEYREAKIVAQDTKSQNARLIRQAEIMVNAFQQTQEGLKGLAAVKDDSYVASSIAYGLDGVCQQRTASGVPCSPPKPSHPSVQER